MLDVVELWRFLRFSLIQLTPNLRVRLPSVPISPSDKPSSAVELWPPTFDIPGESRVKNRGNFAASASTAPVLTSVLVLFD